MTAESEIAGFFLNTGYARLPEPLPAELVRRLTEKVDGYFDTPTAPFRVNDDGEASRIDELLGRDQLFLEALASPQLLPFLNALLGPNVEVAKFRHNHATLNRAGDQPLRLHRDVQQWSRAVLNVFIYLDASTAENGATVIVPGSHNLPYQGPQPGGGGGTWADEYEAFRPVIGQELAVDMPRGGVLLVNGLTFHSVGVNTTGGTRKSLVFACHSSDDLRGEETETHVQLSGSRRFLGNSKAQISGGLQLAPDRA